ncbi:EF-hand domain-containing protein [Pseudaminobacter sp. 19-2017]|uniref:EF-hand domain-containing protein n=1 Tax=Pseudaminobacter soli (ex Zhang et al. 2022) TaxID=2831468 RepID=A0A942E084_9HYPH|nr:EF-hand domain-containing protein [Pseudaminobacter soli]MBS3651329.1 EF-hand domain-containing protein [Pseudaminobacter soli]
MMTRVKMLAGIATVGLMVALPAAPSFAQSDAPVIMAQQGGPQGQISPDQMRDMIRQAVREMMMQRMQEQGGPEEPGGEMMGQRGGMMRERLRERAAEMREEGDRGGWRGHMRGHRHGPPWMMRGVGLKIFFAVMDSNGDGRLTLDEINDFHARIFRAMDKDQKGYLTEEDIREFFIDSRGGGGGGGGDYDEE